MKEELKKKVESILFSSGRKMDTKELARLCSTRNQENIITVLMELKEEYDQKESSLMIVNEGEFWKFTVKEKYLDVVRKIVTQTELTKTVMETLAVLAFKAPMLQSDLIKIRTNKAYDHLSELESLGYITRAKKGRTKLIRLSPKFFEYFDIPEDKLKEKFQNVTDLEQAIEEKEEEINQSDKDKRQKYKEAIEKDDQHKKKMIIEHEKVDEEIIKLDKGIKLVDEDTGKTEELEEFSEKQPGELSPELKVYDGEKEETKEEESTDETEDDDTEKEPTKD